jgi:hypothetical protein
MGIMVFDIETGPLPDSHIEQLMPEFDESTVKTGNLKDEAKIQAKIDAASAAHRETWFGKAALSPLTGEVLAIGYHDTLPDTFCHTCVGDEFTEARLLGDFWNLYSSLTSKGGRLIGFNSNSFDLPFIVKRSWFCGVPVPKSVMDRGRFNKSVDLLEVWRITNRNEYISLNAVAKAFGLPGKSGSGADFAKTFKEDHDEAIRYLKRDVELTYDIAMRMQVI